MDLNLHFKDGETPRNAKHWPLSAAVREIVANALDAAFEGSYYFWGNKRMPPKIEVSNAANRMAGYLTINGTLAASWAVTITKVVETSEWSKCKDTAAVHPQYKELIKKRPLKNRKSKAKKSNDSDSDYSTENSESDEDEEEEEEENEKNIMYRVALLVRSFSVMPLEAWEFNCSTKNRSDRPTLLRKCLIGGFGMVGICITQLQAISIQYLFTAIIKILLSYPCHYLHTGSERLQVVCFKLWISRCGNIRQRAKRIEQCIQLLSGHLGGS